MTAGDGKTNLLGGVSDLASARYLLADLHDDLSGKVMRFRHLADLGSDLGSGGTMLSGGSTTYAAWIEARSSFVHGNYIATVLLCQSLIENLPAAFLDEGLTPDQLPPRVAFKQTLTRCQAKNLISDQDRHELERLMSLRNPLSHFQTFEDGQNLDRRAVDAGLRPDEVLRRDAWFAIGLAVKILAKPPFRLG